LRCRSPYGAVPKNQYDGFDRLSKWRFPVATLGAGTSSTTDYEQYGYDAIGNRTSLRKRDGVTITYAPDNLNRVRTKTVPASATGAAGYTVVYGYDVRGLQTRARFGAIDGTGITNVYDGFGWLRSTSTTMDGTARTVSYEYDPHGNRTRITHPGQQVLRVCLRADRPPAVQDGRWTMILRRRMAHFQKQEWAAIAIDGGFHAGRPLIPAHAGPAFRAMPGRG
jgi:YD repeat-containing protein